MDHEFFQGVRQWEFQREGMQGKIPTFYYDTTSLTAVYTADTSRVRQRLPLARMHPVELLPGRALVAFTAFEYRRTDIDPYNEFSIAFPVALDRRPVPLLTMVRQLLRRRLTAYVWQLPVTTEIARAGGVELFGYPKFIADIDFEKDAGRVVCRLSEKGESILSLTGKVLPTRRRKLSRIVTFSVIDGIPLKANVVFNPIEMAVTGSLRAASIDIGASHAISKELRSLALSKAPIQYQYSPCNQAILFAGRNLMDD